MEIQFAIYIVLLAVFGHVFYRVVVRYRDYKAGGPDRIEAVYEDYAD